MLDSLVRVSRRVGWSTDRFATDPRHPGLTLTDARWRSQCTASSSPQSSERAGQGALRHGKRPRSRSKSAATGCNSIPREERAPSRRASDCPQNRTWHSTRRKCTRLMPGRREARSVRIRGPRSRRQSELNSPGRQCGSTRLTLYGFTYS